MKVVTVQNIEALYAQGYRLVHLTRNCIFEAHAKITSNITGYMIQVEEGEHQAFLPKDLVAELWRQALGDPGLKEIFIMVSPVDWEQWMQLAEKDELRRVEEARLSQERSEAFGKHGPGEPEAGHVTGLFPHGSYDSHGNYHSGGSGYGGGGPGGGSPHLSLIVYVA